VTVDLEQRRAELLRLRERLVAAAEGIVPDDEGSGEINTAAGDQHLADHASDMLEREMDWTLEENAERILSEVNDALARLDAGTYGTCLVCGDPIPEERLAAVPYATLCVPHKREQERG
jgi:RNA polymerase-binding transcription factor DksA